MRFLIVFAIFAFIANIEADEFNIEIPEEYFQDVVGNLMENMGQKLPEGALGEQVQIVIPDKSFVNDIEKLLDQIQEQLPEDSKMHLSYTMLEDTDLSKDDALKNFNIMDNEDMLDDDILDDNYYLDDEYLDDDYLGDDYLDDDMDDDVDDDMDDDYLQDQEYMEDDSDSEDELNQDQDLEEDLEANEAIDLCFPNMCPRIYLPVCASIDGVMRTLSSPCEYSNMVRCTATTNARLGRSIPSFRVLSGGSCDELKEKTVLSRNKRVASIY